MARTTLTLSDPIMHTLRSHAAESKNSSKAQSEVVEDALKEYFAKHNIAIKGVGFACKLGSANLVERLQIK